MNEKIFVVDDDASIRELLQCMLQSYNYKARTFESGEELFRVLPSQVPDLFILDIMLPGIDGLDVLKRLKTHHSTASIPIIMLTAKSSEVEKVTGLDSGADDYITKPFGMLEFMARVRSALRSKPLVKPSTPALLKCGGIEIDTLKHSVTIEGSQIDLTLKEYELLKILILNANHVVERGKLLNEIWGYNFLGETRTLDVHIGSLRNKIGDGVEGAKYIETVRGVGYKINSV